MSSDHVHRWFSVWRRVRRQQLHQQNIQKEEVEYRKMLQEFGM